MATNNPLMSAVEAAERGNFLYGSVQVTGSYVTLKKGVGKATFVEGVDDMKDRRTEVTFTVNPIEETGFTQLVTRAMLAESAEFIRIVWPSLRDGCGQKDLLDLDNKFAKVELVKNGRKWVDKTTGEDREGTTFKFHGVFADQKSCADAYVADGNAPRTSTPDAADDAMAIDMSAGAGSDNAMEREMAKAFLIPLIKQANGNRDALAKTLSNTAIVSKYFDINSPEVAALLPA